MQQFEHRIAEVERVTAQHHKDLYYGNGKPGLTTRMAKAEESLDTIRFYGRWILVGVGGILLTSVVNLIIKH